VLPSSPLLSSGVGMQRKWNKLGWHNLLSELHWYNWEDFKLYFNYGSSLAVILLGIQVFTS